MATSLSWSNYSAATSLVKLLRTLAENSGSSSHLAIGTGKPFEVRLAHASGRVLLAAVRSTALVSPRSL